MSNFDDTTEFMKGALLGYASIHTPEELGDLFDIVMKNQSTDYVLSFSAYITAKSLKACLIKDDKI